MKDNDNTFRIFVDTNILISAIVFPNSIASRLMDLIRKNHHLLICSYSLTEGSKVIATRFPDKISIWDDNVSRLKFELIYTPSDFSTHELPQLRDPKDIPILASALIAKPDIFITGDYDFHTPLIKELFVVYTPADFLRDF